VVLSGSWWSAHVWDEEAGMVSVLGVFRTDSTTDKKKVVYFLYQKCSLWSDGNKAVVTASTFSKTAVIS